MYLFCVLRKFEGKSGMAQMSLELIGELVKNAFELVSSLEHSVKKNIISVPDSKE